MVIAVLLLAGTVPTAAGCAKRATLVDQCREIHGRLEATNGSPGIRIWVIGTRRVLGVAGDEGAELLPPALRQRITSEATVYGDFRVCPVTRAKIGEMQMVCVDAGRRLVEEQGGGLDSSGKLRRLPDVPQE